MALPRERWYLGRIRDQSDLILALRNLERILARKDEIAGQSGGAPADSEFILGGPDADLPNGRVLANGVNTTVDYGTPGEVSIDAPAGGAPTDAQYLTAAASAGLSAERVFQSGTNTAFATTASTAQVNVPNATTVALGVVQLANHLAGTATAPTVRSATTGQTGIVQLANHLGGTATAPTVRSATTAVQGIVELATSGESASGLAVQANDARLSDARPPSGVASGDLGANYPSPTVEGLLGRPFSSTLEPANSSLIVYNTVANQWNAVPASGDAVVTSSGVVNNLGIRGNPVEIGTPVAGDVYRYDGSQFVRWSPKYMTATLAAAQTTNLAGNNHIEFDTILEDSGHVALSTGSGQAQGLFTLPVGVWILTVLPAVNFSDATGIINIQWQIVGGAALGKVSQVLPVTSAVNSFRGTTQQTHFTAASPTQVRVRMQSITALTNIGGSTTAVITAIG